MARYFVTLSYNGSKYNGWQIQQNTPNTVQQVLEECVSLILKTPVTFTGCGRTDAGVNAKNYVAHIDLPNTLPKPEIETIIYKLNKILPSNIVIHHMMLVKPIAHARFDATLRVYQYYVCCEKNPFQQALMHYVYGNVNFDLMNVAAALLCEYDDFTSFSKLHTDNNSNLCRIDQAKWIKCGQNQWLFRIKANRFLRGMVRAIVGTLLQVGRNKISIDDFKKIIEAKDRRLAGENAPANALFLCGIQYPQEIYL